MPISKNQLRRLRLIDEKLNRWKNAYVPIFDLVQLTGVTERTVKEDIRVLRDDYEAPIAWSAKNGGYYYSEPFSMPIKNLALSQGEINKLKVAISLLQQYSHLGFLPDVVGVVDKLEKAVKFKLESSYQPYIHFEKNVLYKGIDLIEPLLQAIASCKTIVFKYQSFKNNTLLSHKIQPYFIKEHGNRWYLIGFLLQQNSFTTFALDRIKDHSLAILEEYFKRDTSFQLHDYFNSVLGMSVLANKSVEEIILQMNPLQSKYFLSKPFHQYQLIEETSQHTTVKINLIINYELIRILAGMGNGVKVLQPQSLADELVAYLKGALQQY